MRMPMVALNSEFDWVVRLRSLLSSKREFFKKEKTRHDRPADPSFKEEEEETVCLLAQIQRTPRLLSDSRSFLPIGKGR